MLCFLFLLVILEMLNKSPDMICPPTPAYSQSLGGEAPGTPQGEAVGQA